MPVTPSRPKSKKLAGYRAAWAAAPTSGSAPTSLREVLSEVEARELTDTIRDSANLLWDMIVTAYQGRVWDALGYDTWDRYCNSEFRECRLRLPQEERAEVITSLRGSGLSLRAIASATGHSVNTVRHDLNEVYQTDTPDEPIEAEIVDEPTPDRTSLPDNVIGLDGKRYPPAAPSQPAQPRRAPVTDWASRLARELGRVNKGLGRLVTDDRFERNRDAIEAQIRFEAMQFHQLIGDAGIALVPTDAGRSHMVTPAVVHDPAPSGRFATWRDCVTH